MAISYNNVEIDTVTFNASEIDTATYNGVEVFCRLAEYVFPNDSARMSSNSNYGIQVYVDAKNSSSQDGWCAFDNDTSTAWMQHSSGNGRMCIVFPFPIRLQSVSIVNKSTLYASTAATVNGIETGYIYVSSEAVENPTGRDEDMAAMEIYTDLNRAQPSATADLYGYSTEHTNTDYANTWIRSIGIKGNTWGPSGTSAWKSVGEVSLKFKANYEDLEQYGLL